MTTRLAGYQQSHRGVGFPLIALHDHLAAGGVLDADSLDELHHRLGLPVAAIRAAASFYADLHEHSERGAFRICHGTSCMLAGADQLHDAVDKSHPCRTVYCLGYCDRSPVLLDDHQRVRRPDPAGRGGPLSADPPPSMPAVRCECDRPIVTERIGRGDHAPIGAARQAGVYQAVEWALNQSPEQVLDAMEHSGERGRGGAGFPTGLKWRRCAQARSDEKYIVANGDEGDPGSFIDRVLLEHDPHAVLSGMICCAYAVGAREGIVFIRSEYPAAVQRMRRAIAEARAEGLLGARVLGRPFAFDVAVFPAMGSYVSGEETAMLNAIEGLRGEVRLRPPYPVDAGLFGKPTVVNNVETLVNASWIMRHGPEAYRALGTERSSGTKALCLNAGFARPGIVEVEFGRNLRDVIDAAGPVDPARPIEAVVLGGPMGSILTPDQCDVPVCYHQMSARGIQLGHGGIVAIPAGTDWRTLLRHWLRFMRHESCGKCTPCRLGSAQALRLVESHSPEDARTLGELLDLMQHASLCAFGQLMPGPMRTILDRLASGVSHGGPAYG